jgi:pimeloyl-ACP methyl ester carboxylesterase
MSNKVILALIVPAFFLFVACDTKSSSADDPFSYLVSERFNRTVTQQQLEFFWNAAGQPGATQYIAHDVDIYRIVYNTTDIQGRSVEASGAILVPKGFDSPGLMSIQHATIFSNDEAPSVDRGLSVVARKAIFSSAGYIAFLPDYLGYGITSEMLHPYQQKESLASASYDMMRAGLEFLELKGLPGAGEPVHLIGYSEGAYASLALAQKLETSGSAVTPGLVSMGAPIFDLSATMDYIIDNLEEPMECVACYAYFLYTYHQLYDFPLPLSDYFNSPYDQRIADGLFSGENSADFVRSQLPDGADELFNPSFIDRYLIGGEPELRAAVAENDLFYVPNAPVLLVHGDADGVAPIFNSDDFEARALAGGKSNLEYLRPEGVTHGTGIFPWGLGTLDALGVRTKMVVMN